MSTLSKAYHSVIFGDKNTWDDWHLIPSARPVFAVPSQKVVTVDIPGADGIIDLSTALTGKPTFNNREGSFNFIVMLDLSYGEWQDRYSEILNTIHGKSVRIILEDDPEWFYQGRVAVNVWSSPSDGSGSTVTIDYSVDPYKYKISDPTIKSL